MAQLSKEASEANRAKIENVKLQKQDQELRIELKNTQRQLYDKEKRLTLLTEEKNNAEQALLVATNNSMQIKELKV